MLAIPWVVLPRDHLFPSRQPQAGDVGDSRLHPASMFVGVRALDLDFDDADLRGVRNFDPSISSYLKRIDRIRNHRPTDSEVISGDCVGDTVPRII